MLSILIFYIVIFIKCFVNVHKKMFSKSNYIVMLQYVTSMFCNCTYIGLLKNNCNVHVVRFQAIYEDLYLKVDIGN